MKNRGFAITGILYSILVLFLILLALLVFSLQNKKTILDRLKSNTMDEIEGVVKGKSSDNSGPTMINATIDETHKGIVYLDPTDLSKYCDESNSVSTTETKTGCMKWYIFNDSGDNYTMILDHNTTARIKWNDSNSNVAYESSNLKAVVDDLVNTSGWKVTPRLITAQEVNTIVGGVSTWNVNDYNTWFFFEGTGTKNQTKPTYDSSNRSSYDWLYNNLNKCKTDSTDYGCTIEDSNTYSGYGTAGEGQIFAYWTSTPVGTAGSGSRVWDVHGHGRLNDNNANYANNGVRPVITIAKETIKKDICPYEENHEFTFDYTGSEQTFTVPCSGNYKLETWGAQGGNTYLEPSTTTEYPGGYGSYSTGLITTTSKNQKFYVAVGGKGIWAHGTNSTNRYLKGGYNGGGDAQVKYDSNYYSAGSGGGATHIATRTGLLSELSSYQSDILIVSGGGGGALSYYDSKTPSVNKTLDYLGSGGGIVGVTPLHTNYGTGYASKTMPTGGTQTTAGVGQYNGEFGRGASLDGISVNGSISGGGGGYYGGGSGTWAGAAGGSGYIGNTNLTGKKMVCYNCTTSTAEATKTESNTCHNSNPTADCSKEGNGYAKITYLGK